VVRNREASERVTRREIKRHFLAPPVPHQEGTPLNGNERLLEHGVFDTKQSIHGKPVTESQLAFI
jgi:hypothetical protein